MPEYEYNPQRDRQTDRQTEIAPFIHRSLLFQSRNCKCKVIVTIIIAIVVVVVVVAQIQDPAPQASSQTGTEQCDAASPDV